MGEAVAFIYLPSGMFSLAWIQPPASDILRFVSKTESGLLLREKKFTTPIPYKAFYLLPLFIDRLMGRGWLAGKTLDLRIVGRRWY